MKSYRIGLGYDVHPFAEGRRLVLGGVEIAHPRGLAGHSDADAVCHAVADALLGALALGDLGSRFADSDPTWRDADSAELLRRVVRLIGEHAARAVNADVVIVADEPRLGPHVEAMRGRLAEILGVGADAVSVKPKRTEGVALGGEAGLAAQAVVLIEIVDPPAGHRED